MVGNDLAKLKFTVKFLHYYV